MFAVKKLIRAAKQCLCVVMAAIYMVTAVSAGASYAWGDALQFWLRPGQNNEQPSYNEFLHKPKLPKNIIPAIAKWSMNEFFTVF